MLPVDLSIMIWNHVVFSPMDLDVDVIRTLRLVNKGLSETSNYKLRIMGLGDAKRFAAGCRQFWEASYGKVGAWTELYNISWFVYSSRDKDVHSPKANLRRIDAIKDAVREEVARWELSLPSDAYVAWVNSALVPFTDTLRIS